MPLSRSVAKFEIFYTQFLDVNGKPTQALPEFADTKQLIALYELMVSTRMFDTKAIALQRTGRLGTYPSSLGQEAIAAAIGTAMEKTDILFPYYREYAAHLARGVTMEEIFLFWGGDERGSDFQGPREDFPHTIPIASQCLHATGAATAIKLRRQPRCVVTAIGDGGTSKGDFYEALNVAGAWQLPVVFVINNNQWAISVPRKAQTHAETLAQKAIAAGIPGEQVDGNDVIAMRYALDKALARARHDEGPSVIEALTYRLCDHTTADDAKRYCDLAELESKRTEDPIVRLRSYLTQQQVWNEAEETALTTRCNQAVEAAVARYLATPPQPPESMFDYLYAKLPKAYVEQRNEVKAFEGAAHG